MLAIFKINENERNSTMKLIENSANLIFSFTISDYFTLTSIIYQNPLLELKVYCFITMYSLSSFFSLNVSKMLLKC